MKKRSGFTLIELLVVIVIIGILATYLVPQIVGAPARARDLARQTTLSSIESAITLYQDDEGTLPGTKDKAASALCINGAEPVENGDDLNSLLAKYFENGVTPADPVSDMDVSDNEDCPGGFLYKRISADSSTDRANSYILIAAAEIEGNAKAKCSELRGAESVEEVRGYANAGLDGASDTDWCMYSIGG